MSVETHPVQTGHQGGKAPKIVTMRAYEVYCHIYAPQEAMVTGNCRSGFSAGELVAFLYAHTFPKQEWRERFDEALKGLQGFSHNA